MALDVKRLVEVILGELPGALYERKWGQLTFTRERDWYVRSMRFRTAGEIDADVVAPILLQAPAPPTALLGQNTSE